MIVRKRCPFTGVVNFYNDSDPHLPVGSIASCGRAADETTYTWRSYTEDTAGRAGAARDFAAAERRLLQSLSPIVRRSYNVPVE